MNAVKKLIVYLGEHTWIWRWGWASFWLMGLTWLALDNWRKQRWGWFGFDCGLIGFYFAQLWYSLVCDSLRRTSEGWKKMAYEWQSLATSRRRAP